MTQRLRGRKIVVTRPRAQASKLADLIAEQGGEAVLFPLLEITPLADPAPLQAAIARLESYSLAIFISPNAVAFSLPAHSCPSGVAAGLRPVAIGQSTVARSRATGWGTRWRPSRASIPKQCSSFRSCSEPPSPAGGC
jgi:uroporphyrinogen-III synthase